MATIFGERWEIIDNLGEGGQAYTFIVKDVKGDSTTKYVLKLLKNHEIL